LTDDTDKLHLLRNAAENVGAKVMMFFGYDDTIEELLLISYKNQIFGKGSVLLTLGFTTASALGLDDNGKIPEQTIQAIQGVLTTTFANRPESDDFLSFVQRHTAKTLEMFGSNPGPANTYLAPIYEAAYLFAHTLGRATDLNLSFTDGRTMMKLATQVSFDLLNGTVSLDANGDRRLSFSLFNWVNGESVEIGKYSPANEVLTFTPGIDVVWPGNTTELPVEPDFIIGALFPSTGFQIKQVVQPAFMLAVEDINRKSSHRIGYFFGEDSQCSAPGGISAFSSLLQRDFDAVVGPMCSVACRPSAMLAAYHDKFQISNGCTSSLLVSKDFPTFSRTVGSFVSLGAGLVQIFKFFSWSKAGIITTDDSVYIYTALAHKDTFLEHDIEVVDYLLSSVDLKQEALVTLNRQGANIIIVYAYAHETRELMLAAYDLGLIKQGYAFFTVDTTMVLGSWNAGDGRDTDAYVAMNYMVHFVQARPVVGPQYVDFVKRYNEKRKELFNEDPVSLDDVDPYVFPTYAALFLYSHAISKALDLGLDPKKGSVVASFVPELEFEVLGLNITMDEQNGRAQDYDIMNWVDGANVQVARYSPSTNDFSYDRDITWLGNTTAPPTGIDLLLGVLIPSTGWKVFDLIAAVVPMAVDEINANPLLLPNFRLGFVYGQDPACSGKGALKATTALLRDHPIDAVIGPGCSTSCEVTALMTAEAQLPSISYGCTGVDLSNRETYPFFARTVSTMITAADLLLDMFKMYGWTSTSIIVGSTKVFSLLAAKITTTLRSTGISVNEHAFASTAAGSIGLGRVVSNVQKFGARVVIMCIARGHANFMFALQKTPLQFAVFAVDGPTSVDYLYDDNNNDTFKEASFGMLTITFSHPSTSKEFRKFENRARAYSQKKFGVELQELDIYLFPLYASVYMYAHAATKAGADVKNTTLLQELMSTSSFELVGQTFRFDENAEPYSTLALLNLQSSGFQVVGVHDPLSKTTKITSTIIWPGNTTKSPIEIDVRLGVMIDTVGDPAIFPKIAAAVPLAISEINNKGVAGGLVFDYVFGEDPNCNSVGSLNSMSRLLEKHSVDAVIGPGCSTSCSPASVLAESRSLLHVSFGCRSTTGRSTFLRTSSHRDHQFRAMAKIWQHYGWKDVFLIVSEEDKFTPFKSDQPKLVTEFQAFGVQVISTFWLVRPLQPDSFSSLMQSILESGFKRCAILALPADTRELLLAAAKLNMQKDYVFMILPYPAEVILGEDPRKAVSTKAAMQGVLSVRGQTLKRTPEYRSFVTSFKALTKSRFGLKVTGPLHPEASRLYLSVLVAAHAFAAAIQSNISIREQGKALATMVKPFRANLFGQEVEIDANGDLVENQLILNWQGSNFEEVGTVDTQTSQLDLFAKLLWPGNLHDAPIHRSRVCAAGHELVLSQGFEVCVNCNDVTYNLKKGGRCLSCPNGLICNDNLHLKAQKGFWLHGPSLDEGNPLVFRCDSCCTNSSGCYLEDNSRCATLHRGALCADCQPGASKWFGICVQCPGINWAIIVASIFAASVLLFLLAAKSKVPEKYPFFAPHPDEAPTVALLLDFLQMGSLAFAAHEREEESSMALFKGAVGRVFGEDVNLCAFPLPDIIMAPTSRLLFWIIPAGQLLLTVLVQKLIMKRKKVGKTAGTVLLDISFLICPLVVAVSLEYFQCVQIGSQSVMLTTGQQCGTRKHTGWSVMMGFLGSVFAVLIPFLIYRTMTKMQYTLIEANVDPDNEIHMKDLDQPMAVRQFYYGIKPQYQRWYQAYFWLRRISTSIILTSFNSSGPTAQTLALMTFFSAVLVFHLNLNPYCRERDNRLVTTILACILCLFCVSLASSLINLDLSTHISTTTILVLRAFIYAIPFVFEATHLALEVWQDRKLMNVEGKNGLSGGHTMSFRHVTGFTQAHEILIGDMGLDGAPEDLHDVVVHVSHADDVPKMDLFSDSDPYVEITIKNQNGSQTQKTSIIKNTKKPSWKEDLRFFQVSMKDQVLIAMHDYDRIGTNRQIGSSFVLSVGQLVKKPPTDSFLIQEAVDGDLGRQNECLLFLHVLEHSVPAHWWTWQPLHVGKETKGSSDASATQPSGVSASPHLKLFELPVEKDNADPDSFDVVSLGDSDHESLDIFASSFRATPQSGIEMEKLPYSSGKKYPRLPAPPFPQLDGVGS